MVTAGERATTKRLTADERGRFWREGYLFVPGLLEPAEAAALRRRVETIATGEVAIPETYRGYAVLAKEAHFRESQERAAHPLDELRKFEWPAHVDPFFMSFARDARILDRLEDLLGTPDLAFIGDQIFCKPRHHGSVSRWHQDCASWPYLVPRQTVTVWIALDDATVPNGCLHYLPGTHRLGLILPDQVPQVVEQFGGRDTPVEVPAGSCLLHHGLTFHSSGPNTTPNRRLGWALHYCPAESWDVSAPDSVKAGPVSEWAFVIRGKAHPGCIPASIRIGDRLEGGE